MAKSGFVGARMNANEATLVWVDEFSRMAEAYDRNVAPRFEPIAREVLRLSAPKANELVLDIGTGTGLLACLVAPLVLPQGVVAIDLADGAISVASYRAGNAGIRNIRFEMLDARNIVYHGKLFDAAVSNLGMPNWGVDRVFQEVHRVLKPGSRFVFSEWPTDHPSTFSLPRQLLSKHGTLTPSKELALVREARQLAMNDSELKLLGDPANVRKALAVAGFDRSESSTTAFPVRFRDLEDLIAFTTSFGWCEREMQEMSGERRRAYETELGSQVEPLRTRDGIEDTWNLNFFRASRD